MDIQEYLKKWADKLSLSIEEINAEFKILFADEKNIHKDLSVEAQEKRALQRLALVYKKQLRSPAVGFEGIVIGVSDCVDIVAKQKREATELYRSDPQTAISEGITNEEGVPLDARKFWANGKQNNMYGKPLPDNNYLRNVFGIAIKSKSNTNPKFFSMVLSGKKAMDENVPTFKPVKFVAIDRTSSETLDNYHLNASQFTNFTIDENMALPNFEKLVHDYCGITNISSLPTYHALNKDDFNRLVVTMGDVSTLNLNQTAMGNRVMVIEDSDASLEDLDVKGLTCWLPSRINIDFAEGSKVIVTGRTAQGKRKDEMGTVTEELGDVTLNVLGLYALPTYKISLPENVEEITNIDLDDE